MGLSMTSNQCVKKLLKLLPFWHTTIEKTLKQSLKGNMSLETYYCLYTLQQEGSMSMSTLSNRLKMPKQQATQLINQLVKHEFVHRITSEEDRRIINIQVSEKAIQYIHTDFFNNIDFEKQLQKKLTTQEIQSFEKAIDTLLKILPKLDK